MRYEGNGVCYKISQCMITFVSSLYKPFSSFAFVPNLNVSLQGWVDQDAEPLFSKWFGGGKKKEEEATGAEANEAPVDEKFNKKGFWPF